MLCEISQRKTNILYMESKNQKWQSRNRLIDTKNKVVFAKGEEGRRMKETGKGDEEVQISSYTTKKSWDNSHSTGNTVNRL